MAEEIRFPIVGEDRGATRVLKDVGRESAVTAVQTRRLAEALDAQKRAAAASAGATIAAAKADKILKDASDDAIRATVEQRIATEKLGASAKDAAGKSGIGALIGSGGIAGGGMGAAIAAGVALSPVIATVGVGLGGLATAAYGVAKPIENAAQKAGGLQANLAKLDPEQRQVARGVLALGKQYGVFQDSLKPQVLGLFNQGLRIAGHVLHDVQPVAAATGTALNSVLASVDREFQGGTWQAFFGFMQKNAAPDIQLLGKNFTDLLQVLPPLIEDMQPLARGLLVVSDDAIKAAGGVTKFYDAFQRDVPISNLHISNAARDLDHWVVDLTNHIPGAKAVNDWITGLQHGLTGTAARSGPAAKGTTAVAKAAQAAAAMLQQEAAAVQAVNTQESAALATATGYASSLVTTANDAATLAADLKKSHDRIGLHTQAQRDSFGAANTYISDLGAQATAAVKSGHGTDAAIKAIRNGLPALEQAKTKNKAYWQEVQTLVGWLNRLRNEKAIHETVFVSGNGTFTIRPGTKLGLPGGTAGGPFPQAAGGLIRGGIPGKDSVLISAMPGEVVVPTRMVSAGLVDHLRGLLPGFGSGGLIPSYHGAVKGLPPWGGHDLNAAVRIFEQATAKATFGAMKAAAAAAARFSFAGGGGGGPAEAVARRMFPWPASMWPAFNYVEMREAGYNIHARNPSSGAYGVAQFINGPGEYYQWGGNPNSAAGQFAGMFNYIRSRYGNPDAAAAHERAFNWYGSGGSEIFTHPTVIGVGERGPERVDVTPVGSRGTRSGPLVHIDNFISNDATDPLLLSQRISFAVTAASLGS